MQCVLLVVFKVILSEQFKIQFSMTLLENLAAGLGIQMGADPVIEYFWKGVIKHDLLLKTMHHSRPRCLDTLADI